MSTLIYILCGIFGVLGRLCALAIGGKKELANRRNEFRFHALVDAWRTVERATANDVSDDALDRALADVRLFGAPAHVKLAGLAVRAIASGDSDEDALRDLRHALRAELRTEMRLARTPCETPSETRQRAVTPSRSEVELRPARRGARRHHLHLVPRADLR